MTPTDSVVRTSHASGLHGVERSLAALHAEMLRSAADDAGRVRLSVLNLVAACIDEADAELAASVLAAIGARHPARAIVVRAHPDAPDGSIEADVTLHRASDRGQEVYTELMRLVVKGEPAFHLASIVTPLLIPDIPIDLWVVGAPRLVQAFSDEAVELTDRIILDSGAYPDPALPLGLIASELAQRGDQLVVGDIAWERTRAWRELIAQAFDTPSARQAIGELREVRIESAGAHSPAQAWLLAGWLAAQLRWPAGEEPVTVRHSGSGDAAALRALRIRLGGGRDERHVSVEAGEGVLHATSDVSGSEVTRTVAHPDLDLVPLMSQLLDESREDHVYPGAVTRAAALAG